MLVITRPPVPAGDFILLEHPKEIGICQLVANLVIVVFDINLLTKLLLHYKPGPVKHTVHWAWTSPSCRVQSAAATRLVQWTSTMATWSVPSAAIRTMFVRSCDYDNIIINYNIMQYYIGSELIFDPDVKLEKI